jgi:hypothetical protein
MFRSRVVHFSVILFCIVLLGAFGFGAAPAHAGGGYWEAWLYDRTFGRVVRVAHDGFNTSTLVDTVLPGTAFNRYISPSRDGRYLAYVADNTLSIYDSAIGSVIVNVPLGFGSVSALDFSGSTYMWDSTNTRFAIGYGTNLYEGPASWTIAVVDVTVGDITMMLTREDPAASAIPADFFYIIPVVQQFNDFTIIFSTVLYASEGLPQYPTFGWDFTGGTTFAEDSYISLALDQNVLGEAVMLVSSSAYPNATYSETGMAIPNIVSAYNAFTGMRQDYLFAPNAFRVNFSQASELVTVSYVDPVLGEPNAILTYTRGGMLVGEMNDGSLPVFNVTSIDGIVGGFIATASGGEGRAGGTTLYRVYTQPGSDPAPFTAVPVWNSTLGANYEIAWVSDEQYQPGSVEPWGFANPNTVFVPAGPIIAQPIEPQLPVAIPVQPTLPVAIPVVPTLPVAVPVVPSGPVAVPVVPSGPVAVPVVPTLPVAVPVQLRIGGQARVQTTAGDLLNVRAGAGRSYQVIAQVNAGQIVSIVQGPIAADGLNWWQIMLPTGVVGWSVESVEGIQTLVPLN